MSFSILRAARRSIPAHAGEPETITLHFMDDRVYPRPRGGTSGERGLCHIRWGLSPPTRGNHEAHAFVDRDEGSIPAHAGEPVAHIADTPPERVYPRPRGGTH